MIKSTFWFTHSTFAVCDVVRPTVITSHQYPFTLYTLVVLLLVIHVRGQLAFYTVWVL